MSANHSDPRRNSYLRSEIETFARTLTMLAGNMPDNQYRRGWIEALSAMVSLAGINPAALNPNYDYIVDEPQIVEVRP